LSGFSSFMPVLERSTLFPSNACPGGRPKSVLFFRFLVDSIFFPIILRCVFRLILQPPPSLSLILAVRPLFPSPFRLFPQLASSPPHIPPAIPPLWPPVLLIFHSPVYPHIVRDLSCPLDSPISSPFLMPISSIPLPSITPEFFLYGSVFVGQLLLFPAFSHHNFFFS